MHCGHRKGNWFDEAQHISPMEARCELRFRYLQSGEIQPAKSDDTPANKMIDVLALDIAYLKNRRQSAIRQVFDSDFIQQASNEDLTRLAETVRSTDLPEQKAFDHVIARYAEQLLGL